jgi:hypothetical protein
VVASIGIEQLVDNPRGKVSQRVPGPTEVEEGRELRIISAPKGIDGDDTKRGEEAEKIFHDD